MQRRRRSYRPVLLAVTALGLLGVPALGAAPAGAEPDGGATTSASAPAPTPARRGRPTVVAAVGDSITQGTGTGPLTEETPKNSWATGGDVNSIAQRLGISAANRRNVSANGARMSDFVAQVRNGKSGGSGSVDALGSDVGLVLVEFGGNDLCRDSEDQMTSVATYRSQFRAGLAEVATRAPDALIQVMSIPDIYNLWYIRGGPQHATYHPEAQSDQASGLNGARFYWGQSFFPCASLLANADSYSQADRDRRTRVRERTKALNAVLAEECAAVLRCRYDNHALFNLTSNRQTPPDGPLKPKAQWTFTDNDISRNTGSGTWLCPVQGAFAGGCGDHFHPSKAGQEKLAQIAWDAGFDHNDSVYPTAGASIISVPHPVHGHLLSATVRFTGSDNVGLRGQEVRVHRPDGTVSAWSPYLGVAPDRTVTAIGTSYVEVRSFDVNGNRSASTVLPVTVQGPVVPDAPGRPTLQATGAATTASWTAPTFTGGAAITGYDLEVQDVATGTTSTVASTVAAVSPPLTASAGSVLRYRVRATNSAGAGAPSAWSAPTVLPFASLEAFVQRQHLDLTGAAPSSAERSAAVGGLTDGSTSAAALIDELRLRFWWDGAYGSSIRLYQAYFGRLPDPSGLDYWAAQRRSGRTLKWISDSFAASAEFRTRYGTLSDEAFVDTLYQNVFHRAPDPGGRAYYLTQLRSGWSRGQVVLIFSDSAEYRTKQESLVAAVELARALDGRAPNNARINEVQALFEDGGTDAVVAAILATPAYRTHTLS